MEKVETAGKCTQSAIALNTVPRLKHKEIDVAVLYIYTFNAFYRIFRAR